MSIKEFEPVGVLAEVEQVSGMFAGESGIRYYPWNDGQASIPIANENQVIHNATKLYSEEQMEKYAKLIAMQTMQAYLQPYSRESEDSITELAEIIIEENKG
ncbi:MAG: hypothetical protein FWF14_03355 [Streptococcaceae bacterium]|nr:hypothetical protein [Streptococcaceae bacterium]